MKLKYIILILCYMVIANPVYAKSTATIKKNNIQLAGLTVVQNSEILKDSPYKNYGTLDLKQALQLEQYLEQYIENRGYLLAEVVLDRDSLKTGALKFDVYEGFIANIFFNNPDFVNPDILRKVRSYLTNITKYKPLHRDTYEKYVLLADELAGIELSVTLKASNTLGAADLYVTFHEFNRVDAFVSYDNMINKESGPQKIIAGALLNTPDLQGQTTLSAMTSSKAKRLRNATFSHSQNFGTEGHNLTFEIARSIATPDPKISSISADDGTNGPKSKFTNTTTKLQFTYVSFASLRHSLFFKAIFNTINSKNRLNDSNGTNTSETTSNYTDRIRPIRLNAHYEFLDALNASNIWEAEVSKGLASLGASKVDGSRRSRDQGKSKFAKFNLSAYRLQYLPQNFSFLTHLYCQHTAHKLLSSEEFEFGGMNIGRGYKDFALAGDRGIAIKLELHKKWYRDHIVKEFDMYAFYDLARVYKAIGQLEANRPEKKYRSAASTGLGFTLISSKFLTGELLFAKPLTFPSKYNWRTMFKITANMNQK